MAGFDFDEYRRNIYKSLTEILGMTGQRTMRPKPRPGVQSRMGEAMLRLGYSTFDAEHIEAAFVLTLEKVDMSRFARDAVLFWMAQSIYRGRIDRDAYIAIIETIPIGEGIAIAFQVGETCADGFAAARDGKLTIALDKLQALCGWMVTKFETPIG